MSNQANRERKPHFYVATSGDDRWSGRLDIPNPGKTDGPFATLSRARDAVRQLKAGQAPKASITVVVRGGKYFLDSTVVFRPEDGGSRECPVAYEARSGEQVILSGGKGLTNWKPFNANICQAEALSSKGGVWKFRQLFLNGEPLRRSRFPKYDANNPLYGGWAFMQGPLEQDDTTSFIYKSGTFPHHWAKPRNGEVFVFPHGGWTNNIVPIKSVDLARRVITLTRAIQNPDRPPWFFPQPFLPGDRFRVENLLEDLTEPGEWCLDSEDGMVYLWPPSGTLKTTDEVVAPALDTLIDIRGASWLTISGFTFTETTGGDDVQRDSLDGYGPMYPNQGWKYCGEALHMREAEHCVIENNRFYAVGGNAIYLERYNARNVIRGNEISYVGANGICLLGNHIKYPVPPYVPENAVANLVGAPTSPWIMNKQPLPMFNEITDNHIHHCGVFNKYVGGIFLGFSDGNLVAHNCVEYLPNGAVNLGQNSVGRNIVEYNEIRHVCMEAAPAGAIHGWMDNEVYEERVGHIIRFNLVIDVKGCGTDESGNIVTPHPRAHAIYLDNYTSNCQIYGNIIIRVPGNGVFIHSGKNLLVENNVFVDIGNGAIGCGYGFNPVPGFLTGERFSRNITYFSESKGPIYHLLTYGQNDEIVGSAEKNIFFSKNGKAHTVRITQLGQSPKSKEYSLLQWQEMGYDNDSVVIDPRFVDPNNEDYRLASDSPAFSLGFVPINVPQIGIRSTLREQPEKHRIKSHVG